MKFERHCEDPDRVLEAYTSAINGLKARGSELHIQSIRPVELLTNGNLPYIIMDQITLKGGPTMYVGLAPSKREPEGVCLTTGALILQTDKPIPPDIYHGLHEKYKLLYHRTNHYSVRVALSGDTQTIIYANSPVFTSDTGEILRNRISWQVNAIKFAYPIAIRAVDEWLDELSKLNTNPGDPKN